MTADADVELALDQSHDAVKLVSADLQAEEQYYKRLKVPLIF